MPDKQKQTENIEPGDWPDIQWQPDHLLEGLAKLRNWAEEQARAATNWYYIKKKWKNIISRWLRFFTILFTIIAGLIPILVATGLGAYFFPGHFGELDGLRFNQFGYVFIGLAAGCVAFDRFFGFSTNWMRYIAAAMRIETARVRFQFDWEQLVAPLKGGNPSDERLLDILLAIQKFSLSIREAVEQETGAWILEFQTNLSQLDKETKALFDSAQKDKVVLDQRYRDRVTQLSREAASIEVKVTNVKDLEDGWAVSIDNSPRAAKVTTESLLLKPFTPGHYHVSVVGTINKQTVQANESVEVKAGALCRVALTLHE